ncbi:MAG: transcription termination factor NusA [Erysipelotrichales bacterium]|nr:transcription termination factor NusA [Erysipelotrichales bacterium]
MIDAKVFLEGLEALENDRGVSREVVLGALKEALEKAFRKQLGKDEDALVRVDIDDKKSKIKMYQLKNVVEEVEDDFLEISLEDAKKEFPNIKIDDQYEIEYSLDFLTKGSVQLVASILRQKIAEAEKAALYEQYKDCIGEMVQGQIEKIDERGAIINIGRLSVFLPRTHMIPGEKFRIGDIAKLFVSDVISTTKGAQVIVSRTDPGFLKRLFETEVHEIYEGTVIIKNIAREAGYRSKVAVYSLDPNVPATGACIGPNGGRIQKIVAQLGNGQEKEKIDIINYHENPGLYIMEALKPANVRGVVLDEHAKKAIAVVQNNELSVAIGKMGVNARLAVKLTGWNIDIKELDDALRLGIVYKTQEDLIRDDEMKYYAPVEDVIENVEEVVEEIVDEPIEAVPTEVKHVEIKEESKPVEEEIKEEVKEVEHKEEVKTEVHTTVKTNKTLADLEKELENEKRRRENANNYQRKWKKADNNTKKEEEEDISSIIPNAAKTEKMDIYTAEELAAFEEEEETEYEDDEDIDYDEFDSYYDD